MSDIEWRLPQGVKFIWHNPYGPEAPGVAAALMAGDGDTAIRLFVEASTLATADEADAEDFVAFAWPDTRLVCGYNE